MVTNIYQIRCKADPKFWTSTPYRSKIVWKWMPQAKSKQVSKRIEIGPNMAQKWVQNTAKINPKWPQIEVENEVGKHIGKNDEKWKPRPIDLEPMFGQNRQKNISKNHAKIYTEKVVNLMPKRSQNGSQNGSQNHWKIIVPFWHHWAYFWLPLAHFWLTFGVLWLTFTVSWSLFPYFYVFSTKMSCKI